MKQLTALLCLSALLLTACEREETFIEKHFAGDWQIDINDAGMDTTLFFYIRNSGSFAYKLDFDSVQSTISGRVNENGQLNGKIRLVQGSFNIDLGNMDGQLNTSGNGQGFYYIINDSIAWTTQKQ